ncbi:MAG TPA: 7-cyano-7-deazaguanine synthase [Nitrospiria bacterium]|nr:7-cyano-7-deazaguanine synthase [Nitrospiria bacterium]
MALKKTPKPAEKNPGSICVLASGGSDSSIMLVDLAEHDAKVIPLYIRNGLVWEKAELYWLRRFLKAVNRPEIAPLQVLDLPMQDVYGAHWSMTGEAVPDHASGWEQVYLPGRNLILLAKTAVYCGLNDIDAIALGPLKTNLFADSSREFFSGFQQLVRRALNRRIEILTPFSQLSKKEVMERGRRLPLELTFSCLNPRGKTHCGACNKCAERMAAFTDAGLKDLTSYHNPEPGNIKRAKGIAPASGRGRTSTSSVESLRPDFGELSRASTPAEGATQASKH